MKQAFHKPSSHRLARMLPGGDPAHRTARATLAKTNEVDRPSFNALAQNLDADPRLPLAPGQQPSMAVQRVGREMGKEDDRILRRDLEGQHAALERGREPEPMAPVVRCHSPIPLPAIWRFALAGVDEIEPMGNPDVGHTPEVEPVQEVSATI